MRRRVQLVSLVVPAALLMAAAPARANIWDYLEQLSGPGPFGGPGSIHLTGGCLGVATAKNAVERQEFTKTSWNLLGIPPTSAIKPHTPCFFFDVNPGLSAEKDTRFAQVDATLYDFGVTFPVWRPLEIGFGVGRMHFDSNGVSTTRTSVTVPRVVIKPLLFVPKLQGKKWPGFFKYYLSMVTIAGLAGQDFGVSNAIYDERDKRQLLTTVGASFDLLELFER